MTAQRSPLIHEGERVTGVYDPAGGDVGICVHCGRTIRWGQPYMGRIPFLGSWGGLVHQFCPPRLIVISELNLPRKST